MPPPNCSHGHDVVKRAVGNKEIGADIAIRPGGKVPIARWIDAVKHRYRRVDEACQPTHITRHSRGVANEPLLADLQTSRKPEIPVFDSAAPFDKPRIDRQGAGRTGVQHPENCIAIVKNAAPLGFNRARIDTELAKMNTVRRDRHRQLSPPMRVMPPCLGQHTDSTKPRYTIGMMVIAVETRIGFVG